MPSASFRFGANDAHEVKIKCGYLGHETYLVDGVVVLSRWSLQMSGVREFNAHGHAIQIRMAINLLGAKAQALVDGEVVAEDLFADFNAMFPWGRGGRHWLVKLAVWCAVGYAVFWGMKLWDERSAPAVEQRVSP